MHRSGQELAMVISMLLTSTSERSSRINYPVYPTETGRESSKLGVNQI